MRNDNDTVKYEAPTVTDHGDLVELTAGGSTGDLTDKVFPVNTPRGQITYGSSPIGSV